MSLSFVSRTVLCAGMVALLSLGAGAASTQAQGENLQTVTADDLASLRSLALDLLMAGDYERTLTVYHKVVELAPMDPHSHYELAAALSFLARYDDAVVPIQEAIRLKPDFLDAYKVAAIVFMQLGRVVDALPPTVRAAQLGDTTSMYELVWFYTAGKGIPVDEDQAFLWAQRAASAGHNLAMELMVDIYRQGMYGQPVDTALAAQWARKARQVREQP